MKFKSFYSRLMLVVFVVSLLQVNVFANELAEQSIEDLNSQSNELVEQSIEDLNSQSNPSEVSDDFVLLNPIINGSPNGWTKNDVSLNMRMPHNKDVKILLAHVEREGFDYMYQALEKAGYNVTVDLGNRDLEVWKEYDLVLYESFYWGVKEWEFLEEAFKSGVNILTNGNDTNKLYHIKSYYRLDDPSYPKYTMERQIVTEGTFGLKTRICNGDTRNVITEVHDYVEALYRDVDDNSVGIMKAESELGSTWIHFQDTIWFKQALEIELLLGCVDDVTNYVSSEELSSVSYRVNDSEWLEYCGEDLKFTEDGWYKVDFKLTDRKGNEAISTTEFGIDRYVARDNWLTRWVANYRGKSVSELRVPDFLEIANLTVSEDLYADIPSEIGLMQDLVYINLEECNLIGEIPNEVGKLKKLESIILSDNRLEGLVTDSLWMLPNLVNVWLNKNNFEGELPNELSNSIEDLYLSNNKFSGEIPDSLGKFVNLKQLRLHNNKLEGQIPTSLSDLIGLTYLNVSGNFLIGEIPNELERLSNLEYLNMSYNKFTGLLPEFITNIKIVDCGNNLFVGELPKEVGNLNSFRAVDNQLVGEIPAEFIDKFGLGIFEDNLFSNGNNQKQLMFVNDLSYSVNVGDVVNIPTDSEVLVVSSNGKTNKLDDYYDLDFIWNEDLVSRHEITNELIASSDGVLEIKAFILGQDGNLNATTSNSINVTINSFIEFSVSTSEIVFDSYNGMSDEISSDFEVKINSSYDFDLKAKLVSDLVNRESNHSAKGLLSLSARDSKGFVSYISSLIEGSEMLLLSGSGLVENVYTSNLGIKAGNSLSGTYEALIELIVMQK